MPDNVRSLIVWVQIVVSLVWCSVACGGSNSSSNPTKKAVCEIGIRYACFRRNCTGHQACIEGARLGECECDEFQPAGSGGVGGAGGGMAGERADAGKNADAGQKKETRPATDAGSATDPTPMKDAEVKEVKDAGPSDAMKPDAAKPATPERCNNGDDDDGDGSIDCADEDCAAMRCIDVAPSGWQGPVAFRTAADPITCSGVFDQPAFEAGSEPEAAAAICSTCSCTGGCSQFVDFHTGNAAQCAGTSCSTSVNASCIEISPQCLQNATTAYLKTALPSNSGCTASMQRPTLPKESWKMHAGACRASDAHRGGCKTEQLCLPETPGGGFEPGYCIWQEGEHTCPSATFTERRLYHRALDDNRTCSPCTCAASSCSYKWRIYNLDDATCANPILDLSSADQCVQINPSMGKLRVGATTMSGGTCTAAGGESRGAVSAAKPLTVCCSR